MPLALLATSSRALPQDPPSTPAPQVTPAPQPAQAPQSSQTSEPAATRIPAEQLDALVAPIALYPDPLLAQTLAASTYPLEIIQLQQWLEKNPGMKDQALADAVAREPWDPSIQAMAALPEVVKRLADDIQWTMDLGNAFLVQQSDVMEAVQRMRKKAQDNGQLQSTKEQKVETQVVENKTVIVVEQADPQVVYVPSYNPVVVYGPPLYYPYPPIWYPPPYYGAGIAVSFGVGVAMGAFWSGGWGWGCGWDSNDVNINIDNNFNRNANIGVDRTNVRNTRWEHNSQHRGGAPYSDRATADRFGGTARGDTLAQREAGARQQVERQGGDLSSGRADGIDSSNRSAGDFGTRDGMERADGAGTGTRDFSRDAAGADSIGGRDFSRSTARDTGGFGGDVTSYSGQRARAASSRGGASMRGGGGGRRR